MIFLASDFIHSTLVIVKRLAEPGVYVQTKKKKSVGSAGDMLKIKLCLKEGVVEKATCLYMFEKC